MAVRKMWTKSDGSKMYYLKTYEDACMAMGITYNDVAKEFLAKMEEHGHSEKSICYAAYKIGTKIIDFLMKKFFDKRFGGNDTYKTVTFIEYDEETFEEIRNLLKIYSWEKDSPKWIAYCERKKAEEENETKIHKVMEEDKKLCADFKAGKYPGAKIIEKMENGICRKVLVRYYVYFIQGENGGAIKIGVSNNPESRLKTLQTGYPDILKILAIVPGNTEEENIYHKKFENLRLKGEWFKPGKELLEEIERIKEIQF